MGADIQPASLANEDTGSTAQRHARKSGHGLFDVADVARSPTMYRFTCLARLEVALRLGLEKLGSQIPRTDMTGGSGVWAQLGILAALVLGASLVIWGRTRPALIGQLTSSGSAIGQTRGEHGVQATPTLGNATLRARPAMQPTYLYS